MSAGNVLLACLIFGRVHLCVERGVGIQIMDVVAAVVGLPVLLSERIQE